MWSAISLWFWFAFPWWLVMLNIFSCACWPSAFPLWTTQFMFGTAQLWFYLDMEIFFNFPMCLNPRAALATSSSFVWDSREKTQHNFKVGAIHSPLWVEHPQWARDWAQSKDTKNTAMTWTSSVQFSCSFVSDAVTPWTAARQASLSITNSVSLLKLMFIESVMSSFSVIPFAGVWGSHPLFFFLPTAHTLSPLPSRWQQ